MTKDLNPQSFIICPNLIIIRDKKILLLRRANWAPLFPEHWHCVTGKVEKGETPRQTIIREALEEVGLNISPLLGTIVSVTARNFSNPTLIWKDLSLFFVTQDFKGEPCNKEPRLHDAMEWFDINNLPHPMIPVVKRGIEHYSQGELYGEFYDL